MKTDTSNNIHSIIESLSSIDDDLLAQADSFSSSHKPSNSGLRKHIPAVLASAAAIFVIAGVLCAFFIRTNNTQQTPQIIGETADEASSGSDTVDASLKAEANTQVTCIGVKAASNCSEAIEYVKSMAEELHDAIDTYGTGDPSCAYYTIMEPFVAERKTSSGIANAEAFTFPVVLSGKVICEIEVYKYNDKLQYAVSNGLCSELNSLINDTRTAVLRYCFNSSDNFVGVKIVYKKSIKKDTANNHPLKPLLDI